MKAQVLFSAHAFAEPFHSFFSHQHFPLTPRPHAEPAISRIKGNQRRQEIGLIAGRGKRQNGLWNHCAATGLTMSCFGPFTSLSRRVRSTFDLCYMG